MAIQFRVVFPVVLMAALLAYISAPTSSHQQKMFCNSSPLSVTSLFVFGDDTVDAGNIGYPLSKHYGPKNSPVKLWRTSNGRSLADLVAEHFNLPYIPPHFHNGIPAKYTKYGVNFASSGCGIGNNTKFSPDWECKPLTDQVEAFYEYVKSYPKVDLDKSMALISIGQNELFFPQNHTIILPFDDFRREIKKLYFGGLKKILITNMPPLGCYPAYRLQSSSHGCHSDMNSVVDTYNSVLLEMANDIKNHTRGFEDLSIRFVDLHSVVQEVIARPSPVGITNVEYPCCEMVDGECRDSSTICEKKDEFVFFDNHHLTERMYEVAFLHMKLFAPLR